MVGNPLLSKAVKVHTIPIKRLFTLHMSADSRLYIKIIRADLIPCYLVVWAGVTAYVGRTNL